MLLNYQIKKHENSSTTPIVFIHGLFGSLSNLGMLSRHFEQTHTTVQIDVRNHGLSGHDSIHNYEQMAQDIRETLTSLSIHKFIVIGHSMGGKIAMELTKTAKDCIEKLIVLDIAPTIYHENHHTLIFKALFAVEQSDVQSRSEAIEMMRNYIKEEMVLQFLLKSFSKGQWLFNVQALYDNYAEILGWEYLRETVDLPSLFLKGSTSFYISEQKHFDDIKHQFPQAHIEIIQNTGHWLHAEKTTEVLNAIKTFLNQE